jgi:TetR/AcrR family transcriptional regulator
MQLGNQNTEELILDSAHKIFKQKGFAGTSLNDIAEDAGVTKSMVNYYYRSKEKLFGHIFQKELRNMFTNVSAFVMAEIPLKEKIEKIVEYDINLMSQFPDLPLFIINEANRNAELVFKYLEQVDPHKLLSILDKQILKEVETGTIRLIKAQELVMNIQSLVMFPIMAKPLLKKMFRINDDEYANIIAKRKKEIAETIWKSIKL